MPFFVRDVVALTLHVTETANALAVVNRIALDDAVVLMHR